MVPLSILDLVRITTRIDARPAIENAADMAVHAEKWGFGQIWVAEHHNMTGIASAATAVVIGYIAGVTKKIHVGAGGIMLPNHAPIIVAEQFRNVGTPISWPHRSGAWARAGNRSGNNSRAAPPSDGIE